MGDDGPSSGLLRLAADSRADARATPVPSRRGPRPAPGPGKAPVDRRGGDDRCAAVRWAARRADVGAPPAGFARGGPAFQGLTPGTRRTDGKDRLAADPHGRRFGIYLAPRQERTPVTAPRGLLPLLMISTLGLVLTG